jgi:hypothetical protein
MWRRVALIWIDISEERIGSIISVKGITNQWITSSPHAKNAFDEALNWKSEGRGFEMGWST